MFRQQNVQIARISSVIVVSLALCFAVGCSRDPNVRKHKYLESGKKYEASGKYKEATIQFANALKVDKNFADAHYEMGKTYLKMGSGMAAYAELMRTVSLDPSNMKARLDLGNLLLVGQQADRAEVQAKAILAANPNDADGYALLAGIAELRKDDAEAMKNIEHALQLDPNRATFHTAHAMLLSATPGNEVTAEAELNKAASLDPKSAIPHIVLGGQLEKKGDLQGAEQQYTAAIAISPANMQPRGSLARVYLREGNKDKAEQTLRQAIQDMPDNEEACTLLRDYYNSTGQSDKAEPVFADLTSKYPKSFTIKLAYAQVLVEKRDFAKATSVVSELTKTDGGNSRVQMLNATLLLSTGKIDDASLLLQKATKDAPNDFPLQLLQARVALLKGDMGTAESSFRAAEKLEPKNMDVKQGLADLAERRGDWSMLAEIADKTIQMRPDLAAGYLWRATAEASRKEYDKAEADYQLVLKNNPDNSVAYLELGQIHILQGHLPEGKAMLEKAVEKDPNAVQALKILMAYDMQAKQPAKALARVQAAIARSPKNANLYDELAIAQLETKDYNGALDTSKKAMQLDPSSGSAAQVYTQAEIALGQIDPAIATWEQWMTSHPGDAHALAILGTLEESKNDSAKAMDYYKKALQIDSNNYVAANNLAYLIIETGGNADVALSLAQTARRNRPDSPDTADTLAWVYYQKGNYSSARDLLEETVKTDPNDASIQYHLGMTYGKLNDKTNAQVHLKKAVAIDPNSKSGKLAAAELAKL